MMQFLYIGELSVPADRKDDLNWLLNLLRCADEFMLDSVKEICEKLICEYVGLGNCEQLIDVADSCQAPNLKAFCEWTLRETQSN